MNKFGLAWDHKTQGLVDGPHADLIRTRAQLSKPSDDPITGGLSDIAVTAIAKFYILRRLVHSPCVAVSSLAAGILGAARQLSTYTEWVTNYGSSRLTLPARVSAWSSTIAKIAGSHANSLVPHALGDLSGVGMERDVYTFMWACVTDFVGSTVSDDAALSRQQITDLRECGVLIKPPPRKWGEIFDRLQFILPNVFTGSPVCRMTYRQQNGCVKHTPLVPARTFALLEYASKQFAHLSYHALNNDSVWKEIRKTVGLLDAERSRYALWACGMSPDIALQLRMFDYRVAWMFDLSVPGWPDRSPQGGGHLYVIPGGEDFSMESTTSGGGQRVSWALPPWAQATTGPTVPVMPHKFGVFRHG